MHAHASRHDTRTRSLSLSLSSCICAPCKTSVWESTSRSTERAVGRGRRRSPSPQYRVPIQVVRRERSGVITTRGGRLLTSASEQKQQDVKMSSGRGWGSNGRGEEGITHRHPRCAAGRSEHRSAGASEMRRRSRGSVGTQSPTQKVDGLGALLLSSPALLSFAAAAQSSAGSSLSTGTTEEA